MARETRACWYRTCKKVLNTFVRSNPLPGCFHCFSVDFVEFESGPGQYPVAIVEDEKTKAVHVILAEDVCFGVTPKFAKA